MKVGVFHPGTQHSVQSALAFHEVGKLEWYATSIFSKPEQVRFQVLRALPSNIRVSVERELSRRSFAPLNGAQVKEFGGFEWLEIVARRLGLRGASMLFNKIGNVAFEKKVGRYAISTAVESVIGFNTSALDAFRICQSAGVGCILDQTIGHPEAQLEAMLSEYEAHPEVFFAKPSADREWIDRQKMEHQLADTIVCGSDFCRDTMVACGVPEAKLVTLNYGFPDEWMRQAASSSRESGPLRVLFLGTLSARKGAYYLLEAMHRIPKERATLTVLGRVEVPAAYLASRLEGVKTISQVPKSEVFSVLRHFDLVILPSLFEGSALVLYEAIGAGLGIIHSRCSGHEDYGNGIQLDHLSVESVREAIEKYIDDRAALEEAKQRSRELRQTLTWSRYRSNLVDLLTARGRRQRLHQ